jgi:site-specific recombinase XerD
VPLLFVADDGRPLCRTSFSAIWRPAAMGIGLPSRMAFHALRHYYASLLIRHGESVKSVQARLGHATACGVARHVLAPVARLRGPDPRGGGLGTRSCGLVAD